MVQPYNHTDHSKSMSRIGTLNMTHLCMELLMEVPSLFLSLNHVQDLPVLTSTRGALVVKLIIEAVLMERVATQEVEGGEGQPSTAEMTLHHLEDLGTGEEQCNYDSKHADVKWRFRVLTATHKCVLDQV